MVTTVAAGVPSDLPEYLAAVSGGVSVMLNKLPLPTESYVANTAWVERDGGIASIFLGMRDRDVEGRLKTRLEVRFSQENFSLLWKASAEFADAISAFVARLSQASVPADHDTSGWKAEKDHSITATMAFMTHSGSQAEIDLFELPATEIHLFQAYRDATRLVIKPVLRVYLSTYLLAKLLGQIRSTAAMGEPDVLRGKELNR